jgi:hypothetical protein
MFLIFPTRRLILDLEKAVTPIESWSISTKPVVGSVAADYVAT